MEKQLIPIVDEKQDKTQAPQGTEQIAQTMQRAPEARRSGLSGYLDQAVNVLNEFGIPLKQGEESQLATLLQDVVDLDQPKVLAIAEAVKYMGTFNELVRQQLSGFTLGNRYETIAETFGSIRTDAEKLVKTTEKPKVTFGDKVGYHWMAWTRGRPDQRFDKIKKVYLEVTHESKNQLERERKIIEGYVQYRGAIKEAEIKAEELFERQTEILAKSKVDFDKAVAAVTEATKAGEAASRISALGLERDLAQSQLRKEDRRYQLLKDVSEGLKISYNLGETLIGRLDQAHGVKEQVYRQSVTFFTTNEQVFSIMGALYNSLFGLSEATKTLSTMKDGVRQGIEQIAGLGNQVLEAGVKEAYGPTVQAESVRTLVDAMVAFQTNSYKMIADLRQQSTENAKTVETVVQDGKQRFASAINNYQAPVTK